MTRTLSDIDLPTLLERLRRRARRLGIAASAVDDFAQETVLRLMQRMERTPIEEPEHYALIILRNLAAKAKRTELQTSELHEDSASVAAVAKSRLAIEEIQSAIGNLPREQRQVMQMVLLGHDSPADIARSLNLPAGTVMSRLARSRVKLRAQIGLDTDAPVATLLE